MIRVGAQSLETRVIGSMAAKIPSGWMVDIHRPLLNICLIHLERTESSLSVNGASEISRFEGAISAHSSSVGSATPAPEKLEGRCASVDLSATKRNG